MTDNSSRSRRDALITDVATALHSLGCTHELEGKLCGHVIQPGDGYHLEANTALDAIEHSRKTYNARSALLATAEQVVNDQREDEYSPPGQSFGTIAALWTAVFGREFTTTDVALAMALVKAARLAANPQHVDSWIDLAGYAACGFETAGLDL